MSGRRGGRADKAQALSVTTKLACGPSRAAWVRIPSPAPFEETRVASENFLNSLWWCRKGGHRDSTIDGYSRVLKHLSRHVDINSSEEVLDFVAKKQVSEARKNIQS